MIKPLLSLIVFVLSLGFAFLYVMPEYGNVMSHRSDLESLRGSLSSIETIKGLIKQTGDSLHQISPEDAARFNVFLPEKIDEIRFANNLAHIGYSNNLILSDIKVGEDGSNTNVIGSPIKGVVGSVSKVFTLDPSTIQTSSASGQQATANGQKYVTTKASFSVVTTYAAFRLFMDDLEKSLGLINVTSLSFKEDKSGSSNVKNFSPLVYHYTVDIETYSLK